MSLSVGVLITNYNSWDLALACAAANFELCGSQLAQVVLVDDHSSPPPTVDMGRLQLVCNETNLGFAKSLNKGLSLLQTDLVVIFDADARPLHNYVAEVVREFTQDPALGLLGFRTVDENNHDTPSFCWEPGVSSLLLGQALHARLGRWLDRDDKKICLFTCAMVIRKEALKDLIGFNEQLDWLDVDLDFSMAVHRSRWSLKINPHLVAYHEGRGTPMITSQRVLKFYKNRWLLLQKFGKIRQPRLTKVGVLMRLRVEYLLLLIGSKLMFRDEAVRRDKLSGRRNIIQYCRNNY